MRGGVLFHTLFGCQLSGGGGGGQFIVNTQAGMCLTSFETSNTGFHTIEPQ